MPRKSGLDIKKNLIKVLKEKECSLRELETKLNTNYLTVRNHCKELEYFDIIKFVKHNENSKNGRPYTTVRLTEKGKEL